MKIIKSDVLHSSAKQNIHELKKHKFYLPFLFAVNMFMRENKITGDQRNNMCLERPRLQRNNMCLERPRLQRNNMCLERLCVQQIDLFHSKHLCSFKNYTKKQTFRSKIGIREKPW